MPNFLDLLTKKFRWPIAGDRLFDSSKEPWDDARIVPDEFSRMVVMADGYKEGADTLVQTAIEQGNRRDFFIYPIVFCYRQYLELTLKWFLWTYGPAVGVSPNWRSHDLITLWGEFAKIQSLSGADEGDEGASDVVAECIREFSEIDEGSFNFRYAMKANGTPIALSRDRVDLARLRDVMEGIKSYFMGSDGFLDHLQDGR
jgi:hypothetical protein